MGAEFDYYVIPDPGLKMSDKEIGDAATAAFEEVAYMQGHGGYTGTLAEKIGVSVAIHRGNSCDGEEEARTFVQDTLDHCKWGPADVVAIKGVGWFVGGWCSS